MKYSFNQFTPAVAAAAIGYKYCSKHPGYWISRPKTYMVFMKITDVRKCPACDIALLREETISIIKNYTGYFTKDNRKVVDNVLKAELSMPAAFKLWR